MILCQLRQSLGGVRPGVIERPVILIAANFGISANFFCKGGFGVFKQVIDNAIFRSAEISLKPFVNRRHRQPTGRHADAAWMIDIGPRGRIQIFIKCVCCPRTNWQVRAAIGRAIDSIMYPRVLEAWTQNVVLNRVEGDVIAAHRNGNLFPGAAKNITIPDRAQRIAFKNVPDRDGVVEVGPGREFCVTGGGKVPGFETGDIGIQRGAIRFVAC